MTQIIIALASALAGALLMGLFIWRGYSVRPTKMSLPFFEADLSRFESLSAVRFFSEVSARLLHSHPQVAVEAHQVVEATPIVLIHAGWNIVCEAFVRRFQAYPDDVQITAAAAVIGGQNVEFVKVYRDIHTSAIRHSTEVSRDFAANYLVRAPSLAERIEGKSVTPIDSMARNLLVAASATIESA